MSKIGLFYASDTGNTEDIARIIARDFLADAGVEPCDFADATDAALTECDTLIIGTPTVGAGEYPVALEDFLPQLENVDFSGKTVALFGLGDQMGYPDEFVDALGLLYEDLKARGATLVGDDWPTDGYDYELSKADQGNGTFCGLVLDEDNQPDQTSTRLTQWFEQIKPHLNIG